MKVVLAYSGGLDTSVILHWIRETYDAEVITYTGDVGQGQEEVEGAREAAHRTGASEAIIETGTRTSVVLALGGGRFRPVDVVTGMASNGQVEILSGIEAGNEVVVSGQFLIDSESSLQASFLRMAESPADGAPAEAQE